LILMADLRDLILQLLTVWGISMRDDIHTVIKNSRDLTHVVILTYNIDFLFLQTMAVPILRHCGHPRLTVFADALCSEESYRTQAPYIAEIGLRYRVVPVLQNSGFRFHPKAILLSGNESASLLIGSGNLTFGGWRENAEIWTRYDTDKGEFGPFSAIRDFLFDIVGQLPGQEMLKIEIEETFDTRKKWVSNLEKPTDVFWKFQNDALVDQIRDLVTEREIRELTVCSPYFDSEANALNHLVNMVNPETVRILVQNNQTRVSMSALKKIVIPLSIQPVKFRDSQDRKESCFIHAKFYAFSDAENTLLISGSSNCSNAGLLLSGNRGNAEVVSVTELPNREFQEMLASEIEFINETVSLADFIDTDTIIPESVPTGIRILSAKYERGFLTLSFRCAADIEIQSIIGDGMEEVLDFNLEHSTLHAKTKFLRSVILTGRRNSNRVESNMIWVNNEDRLCHSSAQRTLADSILRNVRRKTWNSDAWAEIMEIIIDQMSSIPSDRSVYTKKSADFQEDETPITYTLSDVLTSDTDNRSAIPAILRGLSTTDRLSILQQLLLRYLGLQKHPSDPVGEDIDYQPEESEIGEGPEHVIGDEDDLPEDTDQAVPPVSKRVKRFITHLTDRLTQDENYIFYRHPTDIGTDLKIVAMMFVSALKEGWIDEAIFFECTRKIWSSLFLCSDLDEKKGWLEARYILDDSPEVFLAGLLSDDLYVALMLWVSCISVQIKSKESALFHLSSILSMARIPWNFSRLNWEKIEEQLVVALVSVTKDQSNITEKWQHIKSRWATVQENAATFLAVEKSLLDGGGVKTLAPCFINADLEKGELLWQGSLGLCVIDKYTKDKSVVICLQDQKIEKKRLKSSSLIPLRYALEVENLYLKSIQDTSKQRFLEFIGEMRRAFSGMCTGDDQK
jgi:HKD family nuclease